LEEIGDLLDDAAQNDVTIRHIEYNEKYVHEPFCDDDDVKVNVIKSDLGTGKTHQTRQHLNITAPSSALILTPRVIFGQCLVEQLREDNPEWKIYTDIGNGIYTNPFLVCQLNSIWRNDLPKSGLRSHLRGRNRILPEHV
jgi:hypothetical protein